MYLRSCQLWVWLVRHTAFVLTHFRVVHDGIAALRRLIGKPLNGTVAGFSEQVMCKLAKKKKKKKPGSTKNVRRGKTKLTAQSLRGTWLGIHARAGEQLIAVHTGDVLRVWTIHRIVAERQLEAATVLGIRAMPRRPGPSEGAGPDPCLLVERAARPEAVRIPRPAHQDAHSAPRELKLDSRLLDKFGLTGEYAGCVHHWLQLGTRRDYTDACRKRIYDLMLADPTELDRLIRSELRAAQGGVHEARQDQLPF